MNTLPGLLPQESRPFDLICLGRLAVDLYGEQAGVQLEDVRTFAKYLGGSSANIAAGCARLGLQVSMLSRVGNEQFGRFLVNTLQQEGCDTSYVRVDANRLTALAILSMRSQNEFPLLFYRDNCADMAIERSDIDESHIASAKSLVITGTHFSTEKVKTASLQALEYARTHGLLRILDIDYRPVLWGLTDKGDGDTRFIASSTVTDHLRQILPHFQLIVGTEEEFNIAGGCQDLLASLKSVRHYTDAVLLVKQGAGGCRIFDGIIADDSSHSFFNKGFCVDVRNVLGAGDAFLSGFLYGLFQGADYEYCCTCANACGALVVSRHACSPAMPTLPEIKYVIDNRSCIERIDVDPQLTLLHRISQKDKPRQNMAILAFDHRKQLVDLVRAAGAQLDVLHTIKQMILDSYLTVIQEKSLRQRAGVLIDDSWGAEALSRVSGAGIWVGRPIEQPGSRPLEFEGGRNISQRLTQWATEHCVKCLVFYHPDDPAILRYEQERQILELYQACCGSGHQLLLEIIPPGDIQDVIEVIPRIIKRMYNLGVHPHWWKLPPLTEPVWQHISALIEQQSPWCRGVLLLGLHASVDTIAQGFAIARRFALCKGFAIGRTIFNAPAERWLAGQLNDKAFKESIISNYLELVNIWDRSIE